MSLAPGTHIGAYDVIGLIGAGGMGEVYRARDTRLNRDVAIKILPDTFAADVERIARFQREAQVLASLNHPNIAQIYGVEQAGPSTSSGQAVSRRSCWNLSTVRRLPIELRRVRSPSTKR